MHDPDGKLYMTLDSSDTTVKRYRRKQRRDRLWEMKSMIANNIAIWPPNLQSSPITLLHYQVKHQSKLTKVMARFLLPCNYVDSFDTTVKRYKSKQRREQQLWEMQSMIVSFYIPLINNVAVSPPSLQSSPITNCIIKSKTRVNSTIATTLQLYCVCFPLKMKSSKRSIQLLNKQSQLLHYFELQKLNYEEGLVMGAQCWSSIVLEFKRFS